MVCDRYDTSLLVGLKHMGWEAKRGVLFGYSFCSMSLERFALALRDDLRYKNGVFRWIPYNTLHEEEHIRKLVFGNHSDN